MRALGRHSMRIDTDPPEPLDRDQVPARVVEIPVRLHIRDPDGSTRDWSGWYRLHRNINDDGWEISTASMQPQID